MTDHLMLTDEELEAEQVDDSPDQLTYVEGTFEVLPTWRGEMLTSGFRLDVSSVSYDNDRIKD